jgi:DNA-binding MarR family transcriptional regulator
MPAPATKTSGPSEQPTGSLLTHDATPATSEAAPSPHALTRAWQLLTLGADRLRRECATELGISVTELNAIAHLYRQGTITAGHLAASLGLGVAGTTTVIDHLEGGGYARRTTHPDDRRVRLVALTPGGTHAAQWVIERSTQVVAPAVAGTAPEEQARLITLLRAMAATMGL